MSDAPAGRPMRYPYTFSAKIAQFPFKFHIQNNWIYKYYLIGMAASFPFIVYIHNLANSPAAIRAHQDAKLKELAQKHEH